MQIIAMIFTCPGHPGILLFFSAGIAAKEPPLQGIRINLIPSLEDMVEAVFRVAFFQISSAIVTRKRLCISSEGAVDGSPVA